MEKRLRSSLRTSAEEFLFSAVKLPFKSSKSAIKSLINTSVKPSSDITSTLPLSLHNSISHSISKLKNISDSNFTASPITPPGKRVRRSARNKEGGGASPTRSHGTMRQSIIENLQVYAYILRLSVFHPKNAFSVSDLLPAVQELHDNLIFFDSDLVLLSEIANLCEEWWKGDLIGKENLISQSLPVILSRSLTLKKKVDVHKVYAIRDAFMLFDFDDASIEDLKHLLIRCVISPLYLKTEDGRKFVAFLFCLSGHLTKELCAMIKSQIPFGRKSVLEAYGEIVFRAWKAVEGECKYEIENNFLQGLVEGAIYASSSELASSVRRILWGFVNQRTTHGVEKLIFCLAEPVIFRSLQVANSNVRQNALHLLLDLFPLEDPDATKEAKDTLLEKQFFLLEKLLLDECPDVRVVAVEGSSRILHMFWEVIPSPTITKILTKIFDCMTVDACTEVRLSTVNGVTYLLGNPQSHEVLKVLLPRLGNLVTDSSSVVRAALADLLLLLNDIRNFQFHKVVSVDALFSILSDDQPFIARKITKLLIPSYFPSIVTEEEACKRFITLIKRSPTAGARFCEFAALEGASVRSLMKLFKYVIGLALSSIKLDKNQIDGSLTAASHLCTNLSKDASSLAALKKELSVEKLKALFAVASTGRARSAVCKIISTVSLDFVGDLFDDCMDSITKCSGLSDNIDKQAEVRSAQNVILSCGRFDDMFEALVGLLQRAASGCHVNFGVELGKKNGKSASRTKTKSSSKKSSNRKRSNKNGFLEDYDIAVGVAWQIKELIVSESTREAILGSEILESACSALKVISEASFLHCLQHEYLDTCPISAYATLSLHMCLRKVRIDGTRGSSQTTTLNLTLDHLLQCAYNVFRADNNKKLGTTPGCVKDAGERQTGTSLTKQLRLSNMVKTLTAILKFIVDATSMNLLSPHYHEKCLNFTTKNLKFIITNLREHSISQLQVTEEDRRDIFTCLKSSFTYGAKLLNLVLKTREVSSPRSQAQGLADELFDLFVSVEEFLGYGFASLLIPVVQPWIPDLILALGSEFLLKANPDECPFYNPSDNVMHSLPSWFYILARIEIYELRDAGSDEESGRARHPKDFSAFKKLLETMRKPLRANNRVLDAVGVRFLSGAISALTSKNFEVVFGIVRFVCVKLVGTGEREWEGFKSMSACLGEVYSKVERESEDEGNSEGDRENLYSAKALMEPVLKAFVYDDETVNLMEEE